jgi:hypothetical protein
MPKRIDLDTNGGDTNDDLEKALRQLQRPQKRQPRSDAEKKQQTREEVQDAVRELAQQQKVAAEARKPRAPRPTWLIPVVIAAVALAGIIIAVIAFRPEPLPAPATTAQGAVSGFWRSLIDGKYEAATVYCPSMVDKYGSRKQAAERLQETFGQNPPVRLSKVGDPEELPDSSDLRISYEIYLRSGTPRSGEAIVSANDGTYAIVAGI